MLLGSNAMMKYLGRMSRNIVFIFLWYFCTVLGKAKYAYDGVMLSEDISTPILHSES